MQLRVSLLPHHRPILAIVMTSALVIKQEYKVYVGNCNIWVLTDDYE